MTKRRHTLLTLRAILILHPRLIKPYTPRPRRPRILHTIYHHIPQLLPHPPLHLHPRLPLIRLRHLLGIRDCSPKLHRVPVVLVLEKPGEYPLPARLRGVFLRGHVIRDFIQEERRGAPGGVHGEVQVALKFQEAQLGCFGEPGLRVEGREEDGGVDAVHVVEVKFDLFRTSVGWLL